MTKLRAVAHLGMSEGGWTDSKKLIWSVFNLYPGRRPGPVVLGKHPLSFTFPGVVGSILAEI
jgi:hypothetical protein